MFLFADDNKLFCSIVCDLDINQLRADIDNFRDNFVAQSYLINGEPPCVATAEKDLGVVNDQNLKFHQHAAAAAAKENESHFGTYIYNQCFEHLDVDSLPLLYKTLVLPILEYANAIQGLHYITDQKLLEKIQKRATKLVPTLRELPYAEHLSHLRLPSLFYEKARRYDLSASVDTWFTKCECFIFLFASYLYFLLLQEATGSNYIRSVFTKL